MATIKAPPIDTAGSVAPTSQVVPIYGPGPVCLTTASAGMTVGAAAVYDVPTTSGGQYAYPSG